MNRRQFSTGILKTVAMASLGVGFPAFVRGGQDKPGFGTVSGTKFLSQERAADNVFVLVAEETGESRFVTPDGAGTFKFENVPPGKYGVFGTGKGKAGTVAAEIEVMSGESVTPELTSGLWPDFFINSIHSPEPAYTLYLLSRWSELIVIGRVGEIREVPFDPEVGRVRRPKPTWLPWDTEVDISIEKTLKGTFSGPALTAIARNDPHQNSGRFRPGNRVLLHLTKTIDGMEKPLGENQYFTVFPENAERVLPEGREGEYVAFYKKHLARPSLAENDGFPTVVELIEDVETPFSQWDASAYLRRELTRANSRFNLTSIQKTRLASFLFSKDSVGYADVPLIRLVQSFQDPRFPEFLSRAGFSCDGKLEDWANPVVNLATDIFPSVKMEWLVRAFCGIGNRFRDFDPLNIAFDAGMGPFNYNGESSPEKREAFSRQRAILLRAIRREAEKHPVSPVTR
jgi:hypothetical protein